MSLDSTKQRIVALHYDEPDWPLHRVAREIGVNESWVRHVLDRHYFSLRRTRMDSYERAFGELALEDAIRLRMLPAERVTTITIESRATRKEREAA